MMIKALIWDFGGVLLRTEDYSGRERLSKWLGKSRLELENVVFSNNSGTQAQLGQISEEQHWEEIRQLLNLSDRELITFQDEFWSGDKLDYSLVEYIRSLRKDYKIALLSNNFSGLRTALRQVWKIDDLFDSIVISAEVNLLKPDPLIYQLALNQLQVTPDEAIFIDDFEHNLTGARQVGMITVHFRNTRQVQFEIANILEHAD